MEIRNSFCVNYYKALTIRFVRELQSVLRFLKESNAFSHECEFIRRNKVFHYLERKVSPLETESFPV